MQIKRHVGRIKNTGSKIVLVFRTIPDEPQNCLVVESGALPDMWHQNLMDVVDSQEAQTTNDLYQVLGRRFFGDGVQMLNGLHNRRFLQKVPIESVEMMPLPGQTVPLKMINEQIDGVNTTQVETVVEPEAEHIEDPLAKAQMLLAEAANHTKIAAEKTARAYELAPELAPKVGRPPSNRDENEVREKHNERRRKNHAEKIVAAKEEKIAKDIEKKVRQKIEREGATVVKSKKAE